MKGVASGENTPFTDCPASGEDKKKILELGQPVSIVEWIQ